MIFYSKLYLIKHQILFPPYQGHLVRCQRSLELPIPDMTPPPTHRPAPNKLYQPDYFSSVRRKQATGSPSLLIKLTFGVFDHA